MQPTKLIYITGADRSGSTLLDNMLGEVPGFQSVGELRYFWERGLIERRRCGCGKPVPECPIWSEVITRIARHDPAAVVELLELTRTRYAPAAMVPGVRKRYRARLEHLTPALDDLYRAVRAVTGHQIIVDSSKRPTYAYALSRLPDVELHIVHLVRDPRAVAYSRGRIKAQVDTDKIRPMTRAGPVTSAGYWSFWNWAIRRLFRKGRYQLVRYEDLVSNPGATLATIVRNVGCTAAIDFIDGSQVRLNPNHTVSGNPSRFNTGTIQVALDTKWEAKMRAIDKKIVTALTFPWLRRYGY